MSLYLRSRDFPIHLLLLWWLLWLGLSHSAVNDFRPPSWPTTLQYVLLLAAFMAGHAVAKLYVKPTARFTMRAGLRSSTRRLLAFSAIGCMVILFMCLRLSGAFELSFIEYFAKLRLDEEGSGSLTGIRALDIVTKILALPLSYTAMVLILASGTAGLGWVLLACTLNMVAFAYLWQVNYPLIHVFWIFVFHTLIKTRYTQRVDKRFGLGILLLFAVLLASAANRFGGDVLGGLQRYIVGYHLIGFSFYDHQWNDPSSLLHVHSIGRSSLGFIDQMIEAASKILGAGYRAASFENATFNNEAVDIGLREIREFNAFGTLLFGMYRDFHLVGVLLGGLLYGAVVTYTLYRGERSGLHGAAFLMLASAWMVGMMVNPMEQTYFWFVIVALVFFGFVNRGIKL